MFFYAVRHHLGYNEVVKMLRDKTLTFEDISLKRIKGIAWLQKEYGIGFQLAKEIYLKFLKNRDLGR